MTCVPGASTAWASSPYCTISRVGHDQRAPVGRLDRNLSMRPPPGISGSRIRREPYRGTRTRGGSPDQYSGSRHQASAAVQDGLVNHSV